MIYRALIIIQFIVFTYAFGQEGNSLQTYNGPFEVGHYQGTAEYFYYEDNETSERVYDGSFKFYSNVEKEGTNIKVNITGNYVKGLAEGLWKSTAISSYDNEKIILEYSINFKNGFPDGKFNYKGSGSKAGKTTLTTSIVCSFTKGTLTGKLVYKLNDDLQYQNVYGNLNSSSAEGNFNGNGFLDGIWYFYYYKGNVKYKKTINYIDGYPIKTIEIDNQTGLKTFEENNSTYYEKFQSCFDKRYNICLEKNTTLKDNGVVNFLKGETINLPKELFGFFEEMGAEITNDIFKLPGTNFYSTQSIEKNIEELALNEVIDSTGKIFETGELNWNKEPQGKWKIYYDKDWKVTHSISYASYYEIIDFNGSSYSSKTYNSQVGIYEYVTKYKYNVKQYYISGNLYFDGTIVDLNSYALEGYAKWYYENGNILKEGSSIEGNYDGIWKFYHENGQLASEGQFGKPSAYPNDCN